MPEVVGSATIRIIPDTSGFAAALQGQLRGVTGAAAGATGGLAGMNKQFNSLADNLSRAGTRMTQTGLAMTYGVTRPLVRMAEASIGAAAEFDEAVRTVAAVAEVDLNTAEGVAYFEQVSDAAREFGRIGKFSAIEVAQGFTDLARAGLDVNAIISTMPAVLNVATAEGMALAEASDTLIQVFTGFGGTLREGGESIFGVMKEDIGGLEGEFTRFTDVLARASALTTTDIDGLANAFRYAGPVAAQAGLSFEETAGALGLLAQSGFDATVGGTALRGIITRLAIPTQRSEEIFTKFGLSVEEAFASADDVSLEDTRRELLALVDAGQITTDQMNEALASTGSSVEEMTQVYNELGLEVFDASGNMKPLADVIEELRVKGARTGDIMKLFGQRAGPGLLGLMGQTPDRLREITAELELAGGAAKKMADTIGSSATIQFLMLKNALIDLAISIGESGLLEFFTDMAGKLADFTKQMADSNPGVFKFVFALGAALAAMGPVSLALGIVTKSAAGVIKTWDLMRAAFTGAMPIQEKEAGIKRSMAGAFSKLLGPVGLVIAAIGALVAVFIGAYRNSEALRDAVGNLVDAFRGALGPVLERVRGWFESTSEAGNNLLAQIGDNLAPAVQGFADTVTNFVSSGRMDEVLDNISRAAGALFAIIRDVGLPILSGLWDLVVDLAPIVGEVLAAAFEIAMAAADLFLDVIELIIPALEPLAQFIGNNMVPILLGLGAAFIFAKQQAIAFAVTKAISGMAGILFNIATAAQMVSSAFLGMKLAFTGAAAPATLIPGTAAATAASFGAMVATLGAIAIAVAAVAALIKVVYDRSEAFRNAVSAAWEEIQVIFEGVINTLGGLWDTLAGIFSGDGEAIVDGLKRMFDGLVTGVLGGLAGLLGEASRLVGAFFDTLLEALGNIPVIGPVFEVLRGTINGLTGALGGLFDILQGIFSLDMEAISEGWNTVVEALSGGGQMILDAVTGVGEVIANFFTDFFPNTLVPLMGQGLSAAINFVFGEALPAIGQAFSNAADALPAIGETLRSWIVAGFDFLSDLPSIIWDAITGGGGGGGGGAGDAIGEAVAPGPEQEQTLGQKIGEFILNALQAGIQWLITNLGNLGQMLLSALDTLFTEVLPQAGQAIFNAILEYGPTVVSGLLQMIAGIAEFSATLAIELGKVLLTIVSEATMLGLDLVGTVGGWLIDGFVGALHWVLNEVPKRAGEFLDAIPKIITAITDGITAFIEAGPEGMLGMAAAFAGWIGDAFSNIGDFLGNIWDTIWSAIFGGGGTEGGEDASEMIATSVQPSETQQQSLAQKIGQFFLNAITGGIEWLVTNIPQAASAIGNAFMAFNEAIINALASALPGIIQFFIDLPGNILSAAGDLGAALVEGFVNFAPELVNFFVELPGRLGDIGGALISGLANIGSALWDEWLYPAFSAMAESAVGFMSDLPGMLWDGFVGALELLLAGFFGAADLVVNAFFDGLIAAFQAWQELPGLVWNLLTTIMPVIGQFFLDLPGHIWNLLSSLGSVLWSAFQTAVWFVRDMFETAWDWLWEFFTGLPERIGEIVSTMGETIWDVLSVTLTWLKDRYIELMTGLITFFVDLPGNIVNAVSEAGPVIWDGIVATFTWLKDRYIELMTAMLHFWRDLPGNVINVLGAAGEIIWGGISATFSWLKDRFLEIVDGVWGFFSELPGRIADALSAAGETIWTVVSGTFNWLKDQITSVFQSVIDFILGIPDAITGVAKGIANVFRGPINWVLENVWGPFANIVNDVADKFGLGRPMPEAVQIPPTPDSYHTGGMVGGGQTGDEVPAVLQVGEGVLPLSAMKKLTAAQFEMLRKGKFSMMPSDTLNPRDEMGGLSIPNPIDAGKALVEAAGSGAEFIIDQGRKVAGELFETAYNSVIKPLLDGVRSTFPNNVMTDIAVGAIDGFAQDIIAWVKGANEQADSFLSSIIGSLGNAGVGYTSEGGPADPNLADEIANLRAHAGKPMSYPALIEYLAATGVPFRVTSTLRNTLVRGTGRPSLHNSGRAVDFAEPGGPSYDSPGLLAIYKAFDPVASIIRNRIYSGPGGGGATPGSITWADHHDHVHVALREGGIINDAIMAVLGEAGREVVIPLNNPVRALQLARSSGLFAVLAQAAAQTPVASGVQTTVPTSTTQAPGEAGFLGGGPGNTYHIYGVTMDQVRAEIAARDEAATRGRF